MNNIRNLRINLGLTQKHIAQIVGCSVNLVSNWECGKGNPQIPDLIKIADTFDVSVDYLVGRVDEFGDSAKTPKLNGDKLTLLDHYDKMTQAKRKQLLDYARFLLGR